MTRLVHLDGRPGVATSTVARPLAADPVVAAGGGVPLLEKIHDDLARHLRRAGTPRAVGTAGRTPAEVHGAVRAVLAA